jgi:tryptophan halogenase
MINKLLILGGGTSGLVNAIILKSIYQKLDITIVKSSDIGIIGVGEGSTEHWARFMQVAGLSIHDLLKETDATFKSGIKFINWNGDDDYYFHSVHSQFLTESYNGPNNIYLGMIAEGKTHHDIIPDNIHKSVHYEPLEGTVNQFHFNTMKLNDYLIKQCLVRDIKIIDDTIDDVILDNTGHVSKLIGKLGEYSADFFVDCSGFKRVISSKLGAKWVDCSDYLPMNSAFAFPTEKIEDIPSHTLSTAMSSGWMWRIPTVDRFGNGYVYCDKFITDEQAIAEAQSVFSSPINIVKTFKFTAGYVDKFWIKNCVSVGLVGSFVEPLEASSIGTSIQQAFGIANSLVNYERGDQPLIDKYNHDFESVAKNIIDFVQLHYITKREDSAFWKDCKNLKLTEFNQQTLEHFKKFGPNTTFFSKPYILFREVNWLLVMHGLNMLDIESIKHMMAQQNDDILFSTTELQKDFNKFVQKQNMIPHRECLNVLKSRNSVHVINIENQ